MATSQWWNLARGAVRATNNASQALGNAAETAWAGRRSSAERRGILGPDDGPPSAGASGLWDYRGTARRGEIARAPADFPLGRRIEPRGWSARDEFGLPEGVVNEHSIVLGPTRSGKTASVIAPWIVHALGLGYSVVAVDVKGRDDLLGEIKRYNAGRPKLGVPVLKWDYTDPARSASWNWIADLSSDGEINAAVEAICGRPSAQDANRFFHQSAIKYLRGLLMLAPTLGSTPKLDDLLALLTNQNLLESLIRSRAGHPGAQRLAELCGLSPGEFIKHTMELKTHLETLDTAGFKAVTGRSEWSFDMLRAQQPVLVIVAAPAADLALADASCSLFLGLFLQRVLSGFGQVGRPTLLALDEAHRVRTRIDLPTVLAMVAGAGVSVVLGTQDVSQFQDERDTVMANVGNMICLPRVSRSTTDFLAGRLGEQAFESRSRNRAIGPGRPTTSWTHTSEKAAVLGHREISTPHPALGPYPGVVHCPSLSARPILVDLTRADLMP